MIRVARRLSCVIWFAIPLALAAVPSVSAQDSSINAAAAQVAEAISNAKKKSAVVSDFLDPDEKLPVLGRQIANDFSAALTKLARDFKVEDRPRTDAAGKTAPPTGSPRGAARVVGTVLVEDDQLRILVECFSARGGKALTNASFVLLLSSEMKSQITAMLGTPPPLLFADLPHAGKNGYTTPDCIYCPYPRYTKEATRHKAQGMVILDIVVGDDGRVGDVKVLQPLPDGLTQQAIKKVQTWKLKPANGPDGKPAAVVTRVQLSFHLF